MGLFDHFRSKYPLPPLGFDPLPDKRCDGFQTKSFDFPGMDVYELRRDGSLWKTEQLAWDEEQAPFKPYRTAYSGTVTFYSAAMISRDTVYEGLFDDGALLWIKVLVGGETVVKMRAGGT